MLQTIAIILLAPWLPGMVASTAPGGFIHVLLVVAIVLLLLRFVDSARAQLCSRHELARSGSSAWPGTQSVPSGRRPHQRS